MSVSHVGVGGTQFGNMVTALTLPTVNASTAAGDLLLAHILHKPETSTISDATPAGFTYLGRITGGAGSFGVDTGPVQVGLATKVADGSEAGNTITFPAISDATANDSGGGFVTTYRGTLGDWAPVVFVGGADASQDTSWSVTATATMDLAAGDYLSSLAYGNSDAAGIAALTTTASGATLGTATSRYNSTIASGNDSVVRAYDMAVTTGATGCTIAHTATLTQAIAGVGIFARIRDQAVSSNWTYGRAVTIG